MKRLHPATRFLLLIAVLSLASAYFLPLWQIHLWAPQYPEGLNMKIWIDRLSGSFDIINGLNHYIGMALIKEEMFPEFGYMIYLLGALMALGLLAVVIGTRKWLWTYVSILALGGAAGLVDFYRWGYEYGHNLDPNAPIQVPGMTYQPPLIGYKNLLNFTAYSGPDLAGWVMIVSGSMAGALLAWEVFLRKKRAGAEGMKLPAGAAAGIVSVLLMGSTSGCEAGPEPMRYGQDECAECKMIISDQRFGAQLITRKGKVFKFDDVCCLKEFTSSGAVPSEDVALEVVSDFEKPNAFIPVADALFLTSDALKSPMRSDSAAFASEEALRRAQQQLGGGTQGRWTDLAGAP